jgi:hypothetical protein
MEPQGVEPAGARIVRHKLSEKKKEEYQKEYIVEGGEDPKKQICRREGDVINAQDKVNVHEDEWAITELKNVTAKLADGRDANLLNAVRDGNLFVVKGDAHVDTEFKGHCKSPVPYS